ncbi:MAG: MFS transporter [Oscillospiraceae bacterium]|nr:MFS transporter [Oscillospiraceae bacterium]
MERKNKLTPLERSWVLYDIGNSAYILLVATLLPIYFKALMPTSGINEEMYLSYWADAGALATVLVAILGPICGTLADQKGFKKPFFLVSAALGVVCCAALGVTSNWLLFLGIYILSKVGFNASLVFYDAMLPEITVGKRMDKLSSLGYAFGYIGSVIPFVACLVLVLMAESFGLTQGTAMIIAFLITATWWAICTGPLAKRYRQTAYVPKQEKPIRATFRQLATTFRSAKKEKHIFLYLLAFFFFINGVYTIIDMATAYGEALGLDTTGLLLALLVTQVVAFPFAILFGRLAAKVDSGKLIKICILCYTGITLFAMFLMVQWQFWVLAVLVGMFQGAIQALSRSYLGKIIPQEQSGEYFGLMDICGKGASFLGMFLIARISQLTIGLDICLLGMHLQHENLAVGALVILFVIGFILFCKADKLRREKLGS